MKTLIIFAMIVGSSLGSYLPVLWGGSVLSMASLFWSAIGGFLGIWAGYRLAQRLGLG